MAAALGGGVLAVAVAASSAGGDTRSAWPVAPGQPDEVRYNRDVRPILADRCFACHGPDAAARKAGLRLDNREDALRERDGVRAIVPGDPGASEIIRRILSTDPDEKMPPPESKLALTDEERDALRAWIAQGAVYERHWAFQPLPDRVAETELSEPSGWVRDPLDRFVLRRLESEGLSPSPPATRERWLRRVSFDLVGLPPTPEEIDAFLADRSDDAFERVVDRLLASPHFGERQAVPWLDAARYADSYGFQSDLLSPTWPWRDWVVRAFNDNMPYDEFLTRQLAGDMLPGSTPDDRLATAFNRLHRMTNEGGSIPEEWRIENAADRVHTFGTSMLGLTLECARCHDHKYDPVSQREYYALMAFFNSIDEHGLYERADIVPTPSLLLPTDEQRATLERLNAEIEEQGSLLDAAAAAASAETRFAAWLETTADRLEIPDVVGRFRLDEIAEGGVLANEAAEAAGRVEVGDSTSLPSLTDGRDGKAVALDGDNLAHLPGLDDADRWTPLTVALWVRDTQPGPGERVVVHRSGGTDAGHYGFDLLVDEGRLIARCFRHWPGNAIAVRTTEAVLAPETWTHVTWRYDGSSRAGGLSIFVSGERAEAEVVRDRLWKPVGGGSTYGPGGRRVVLGQRFRDRGMRGGEFDDVVLIRRAIADVEARWLSGPSPTTADLANVEPEALRAFYLAAIDPETHDRRAVLAEARRALVQFEDQIAEVMVMEESPEPRRTDVLARGEYDAPRSDATRVERGVPRAIAASSGSAPSDRLELARWLTSPEHPLTARVAVNRLWQVCFGRGLVESSENFGVQGRPPSHPELLDSLARDFIESGWDTKAMLRRLVLSATYRQDSSLTPELLDRDPENRLLARGPSRRLDAEMLRDLALAASGLLVEQVGGPPVSPYQPADLWREFNGFSPAYRQGSGDDLHRRSLYTVWKRTAPMPNMVALDAPGREACVVRRSETNSPLQALVLLNDPQFVEAARALAQRVLLDIGDDGERVATMFRLLAGRRPTADESGVLRELLASQRAIYGEDGARADALMKVGEAAAPEDLDPREIAAFAGVAQAIMSSDAAVWKR